MTSKCKIVIILCLLIINCSSIVTAENSTNSLNITADHTTANLKTEISRLEGNVLLKHNNVTISGDAAEVQPASDKYPQQFIISGVPVHFKQMLESNELIATALQVVYLPSLEQMQLQNDVTISQTTTENQFDIEAEQLKVEFKIGKPNQFIGTGNPLTFSQQLPQRKIQIFAEQIIWDAGDQIATLSKAKVLDAQTSFAADELKYNTLTGEISAIGSGDSRPSYRFNPKKSQESKKSNDS